MNIAMSSALEKLLVTMSSAIALGLVAACLDANPLAAAEDAPGKPASDAVTDAGSAVERYNRTSDEYNSRCANRPMDPGLVERAQATLACP